MTDYTQLDLFELSEEGIRTGKQADEAESESINSWFDHAQVLYEARKRINGDREFGQWWAVLGMSYGTTWRKVLVKVGKRIAEEGRPPDTECRANGRFDLKAWADGANFDIGTSGQDAWFTPKWVFEGLDLLFDLDVAAPPFGVPWIPARSIFTEDDDGLAQDWQGVVWCNPPYSSPTAWCHRFVEHPDMALLIRADLSTGGPLAAWTACDTVWVPGGRLDFVDGVGNNGGKVTFSTIMLGRGEAVDAAMHRLAKANGTTRTLV